MKLIVPVSACLTIPSEFRKNFKILGQSAQIGGESIYIDKNRLETFHAKQRFLVRFKPIAMGELVSWLHKVDTDEEIVLLTPSANFDATPYSNLIHATLYEHTKISTCALNCYGHALGFLLQGAVTFLRKHNPSLAQFSLFIEAINDSIKSYIICRRAPVFEPVLTSLQLHRSRLFDDLWRYSAPIWTKLPAKGGLVDRLLPSAYRAEELGWQLYNFKAIEDVIATAIVEDQLAWVDIQQGAAYAQRIIRRLHRLKDAPKRLITNQLNYVSRTFPEKFALVTITPNKAKIEKMSAWILRLR